MSKRNGVGPTIRLADLPSGPHIRTRGRLPHLEAEEGTYLVTFRLADSLPREVMRDIEVARAARCSPMLDWRRIEEALDRSAGACYLRQTEIANIVKQSTLFLNGRSYRLMAWVIMPNHVHLVIQLLPGRELSEVMHQLKSYTAKEANKALHRSGTFW